MKSSGQFFISYYLKKHLGFLFGYKINATDIFWKNFYRYTHSHQLEVLKQEDDKMLVGASIADKNFKSYIRTSPSSDIFVFRQIFEGKEYVPLMETIRKNNDAGNVHFIVDAGANAGYTSLFFKLFFPGAVLAAIEPDTSNAEQIRQNMAVNNIDKIDVVVAGVWSHDCWLELKKDKSRGEEWGFYVTESDQPTGLKAINILNIPQLKNFTTIDILKIDIEGSEAKLFEDKTKISALLQIVRYLAIEIHDDMADRSYIQSVLNENGFTWFETGELTIATNTRLLKH